MSIKIHDICAGNQDAFLHHIQDFIKIPKWISLNSLTSVKIVNFQQKVGEPVGNQKSLLRFQAIFLGFFGISSI